MNRNGESIPCEVTLVKAVIGKDDEDIIIAYSRDLRELKRTLEIIDRLKRQACYDALTGCLTREYFIENLTVQFQNEKTDAPVMLGLLDLDGFKNVNDTYGHEAGDMTLKRVIKRVGELLPEGTLIGRFSGDEFLFLLQGEGAGVFPGCCAVSWSRFHRCSWNIRGIFSQAPSVSALFSGHRRIPVRRI